MAQLRSAYCHSEPPERPDIEASNGNLLISFQSAHGLRLVWHQLTPTWQAFMIWNSWENWTIFWLNSGCKMRFKAPGVPCTFRVPEKTIPVALLARKPLQAKMSLQSLQSLAGGFCGSTLGGSLHVGFLRTMGGFFPHGQNLWLSKRPAAKADLCCGCWAPGSSKRCLILYVAGPGPLAPCCLQTVLIWRRFSQSEILKKHQLCKWATCC